MIIVYCIKWSEGETSQMHQSKNDYTIEPPPPPPHPANFGSSRAVTCNSRILCIQNMYTIHTTFNISILKRTVKHQHSENTGHNMKDAYKLITAKPVFKGHFDDRTPSDQGTLSVNSVMPSPC